jgi:mono/diheme cytochrome c family protein
MKHEPGMSYHMKTLNKVFAVLSIVFLLSVVWLVLDDYIRPWKAVQIKALDIQERVIASKIKEAEKSIDGAKLKEARLKIENAQKELDSHQSKIDELNEKINDVQKQIYVQNMNNGKYGSNAGEYQFKYEHALMEKHFDEAKKLKEKFDDFKKNEIAGKDHLKALILQEEGFKNEIKKLEENKVAADKELKTLIGDKERLEQSLLIVQKNPVWLLRNSPFIDYLDPTIKIQQYVIKNVTDDRYFQHVPKIDRCTTCHVFIDKPGFEEQENPYRTHPKLNELAVGVNSPHPIKDFGCTSCHGGVGDRVNDFNSPVHVPQNEEQKKQWIAKYHWHEPHKIPQPMLPLQFTEGMCIKCHQGVERIPLADKLNEGRNLIEQYGCYGCHKIDGWQHLKKPGPSLLKITGKTSKEFIKNWIWNPYAFNPKSKMPAFFMQANNSRPDFMKKNMTEVNAMAEYLWKTSKDYSPFQKYAGGDVAKGKEAIQTVGCVACHMVEGIEQKYNDVKARKGTYLTGTGSKVDPDWLISWLKKPSHYQEDTIMPSFRLSDAEANNITAYLMSLKNPQFTNLKFSEIDKKLRDEILVTDYFSAFEPIADAEKKLSTMNDDERTMELGRKSINKYGCYSCHNINGFEGELPQIGPELTKVGSKPVEQFGFGQQKQVGKTRQAWLTQHLKQPSIWDIGVPKPFKDLNKMPNFYLSDAEVESIIVNLLGQVSDVVPMAGKKNLNANEKFAETGKKIVNKYNCQGCHKIDGNGGDITSVYSDDLGYGPPYLVKEGHRVKTEWFYNFLRNVHPIRTYVNIRMPSFNFSNEEINKIITYFQADSDQITFEGPEVITWEPGEREAAVKIWNELACTTCHTIGFTNDPAQAPALKYAKARLRGSWIEKWITNPTDILPYTSMPNFWDGGNTAAVEGVLDNDPKRQIRAIKKYVQEMGYDSYPAPYPKN